VNLFLFYPIYPPFFCQPQVCHYKLSLQSWYSPLRRTRRRRYPKDRAGRSLPDDVWWPTNHLLRRRVRDERRAGPGWSPNVRLVARKLRQRFGRPLSGEWGYSCAI